MVTSLVQFYHHIMLLEWFQNFDVMMLSVYEILCQMSISFLSIYSCYAAEILLEILMPLHYDCAFRWPLATSIKWFA